MNTVILSIEQLNLKLPSGFEKRADAIARDVVRQLARMPVTQSLECKTLMVPRINVFNGETNQVIARRIAQSIHAQLHASVQPERQGRFGQSAEVSSVVDKHSKQMEKSRGTD
ncbi:hypothetical protein [Nitrosomonas sp.]|uniref:hypothetical protein n=1 Tax=Nitrosomonas sp. TaxID=42353 RepID=UPI001DA258F6|nr:hypothetical protein [Nitrosomonas sp.]MCB1948925.1 hypothetical protein [Nitrosomonas sp.]MCP5243315.1 hypothetical protein [Burkholderiales bacterium]MDR4515024.1 hypothetical protein [Nitrosomonas sp.]